MSEILCRSRPQLAAFSCCGRNVVRSFRSIFCTSFTSTYPAKSGAGLEIRSRQFHIGHTLRPFRSMFSFNLGVPSRVFLCHAFRVCSPFSSARLIFFRCEFQIYSSVELHRLHGPTLTRIQLYDLCFASILFVRACRLITPYASRVQVIHTIHFHQFSHAPYFTSSGVSVGLLPFRYLTQSFLGRHRCQCRVNRTLSLSTVPQCPSPESITSQLHASGSLIGSQCAGSVPTSYRWFCSFR